MTPGKPSYICEICNAGYSRAEFLRRHKRSVHQKEAGKTFHCLHCDKSFARSDVLSRHRRRCHTEQGGGGSSSKASASASASDSDMDNTSDAELVHKLPINSSNSGNGELTNQINIFDSIGSLIGADYSADYSADYGADYGANYGSDYNTYSQHNEYNNTLNHLLNNPNLDTLAPEKAIRRIEFQDVTTASGTSYNPTHNDANDRFFIPQERFAGPYSIAHWGLPPLNHLSVLCANALQTTNVHLPLMHLPSFKLSDTSVCVAFALCSTGGNSPKPFNKLHSFDNSSLTDAELYSKPGASAAEQTGIIREVVRHEKLAMIHGSLSNKSSKTSQSDFIGLIMALLIYYAPVILEEDAASSIWDGINGGFGFICEAMRSSGLLQTSATWLNPEKPKLTYLGERSKASVYMAWKNWVKDEQKRRAIFIIYLADLLGGIAQGKPPTLRVDEMSNVPLPANEKLWAAPTAQAWASLIDASTRTPTHGEMMLCIFNQLDGSQFSQELGPFARNILISSILRGLLDIGLVDGGSVGRCYLQGLDQSSTIFAFRNALIAWRRGYDFDILCQKQSTYEDQVSFQRQSTLFSTNSKSNMGSRSNSYSNSNSNSNNSNPDSTHTSTSTTSGSPPTSFDPSPTKDHYMGVGVGSNGTTTTNTTTPTTTTTPIENEKRPPFVSEPLPFFWMAQLLLNIISPETSLFFNFVTPPQQTCYNVPRSGRIGMQDKIKNMDLKGMLIASRTFARMQEGMNSGSVGGSGSGSGSGSFDSVY
ncbi:hypothetical protein E3P98_03628 [Wallemia ichthyophaga]|nr:hypothetical protein E3P98_03628 [Wallemia ichthyophaga]